MNKQEFLTELARLLQNIPENEREEALKYYEDYFSDAGEENEQNVLAELESPQKVADNIKDGLRANMDCRDGMPGSGANSAYQSGAAYQNGTSYQGSTIYQGNTFYQNTQAPAKEGMPAWAIVLIVIGCIICSPLIIGLLGMAFGLIVGILGTLFGLVAGFGGAGIGLLSAGIAVTVVGFMHVIAFPFPGLLLAGIGLIMLAIGMLCIMFVVWLCGWALPAICRGIAWLWKKSFNKAQ